MKQTLPKQTLILVAGSAGVGKSTISKQIADAYQVTYIDKDVIQEPFTSRRIGEYYDSIKKQTYDVLFSLAHLNLNAGQSVILDAPFGGPKYFGNSEWKTMMNTIASGAEIKIIWCLASKEIRLNRLKERGLERDIELFEAHEKRDVTMPTISFEHIVVDTEVDDFGKVESFLN